MIGFVIQRLLQAALVMVGHVGAGVRRRLRDRQPDRRADLARRRPGHPRADHRALRPRPAAVGAVPGSSCSGCCTAISAARSSSACRCSTSILSRLPATLELTLAAVLGATSRRAARHLRGLPAATACSRKSIMGALDPRLLGADLLGRPDADLHLRGGARLPAGRRPRRDRDAARHRVELSRRSTAGAPAAAGAEPRRCSSSP